MNCFFLCMLFAWFVFPVNFKIIPHTVYTIVYSFIPILYFVREREWLKKIIGLMLNNCYMFYAVISLLIACVISLISILINQSYEFSYIFNIFLIGKNIIVYLFLYRIIQNKYGSNCLVYFMIYYIVACMLYMLSTCIIMSNNDFRLGWLSIIDTSNEKIEKSFELAYVTRVGWAGFSPFMFSFKMLMGFIFSIFLLDKKIVMGVVPIILLVGTFFYGRIGGFLALTIFMVYAVRYFIRMRGVEIIKLIFTLLLIWGGVVFLINKFNDEFIMWYSWISGPIETFINGLEYGQISFGGSADHMYKDMYFVPDEGTLLFGDGEFTNANGSYYMNTDVGFMRSILFFGIPGTIMAYLSLFFIAFSTVKNTACKSVNAILLVCILLSTFIFECKGLIYVISYGYLFIIWADSTLEKYRNGINEFD